MATTITRGLPMRDLQDQRVEYVLKSKKSAVQPLVSVVVPTRNHARLLRQLIAAVMGQDLEAPLELIVCDNASEDETEEVMSAAVESAQRPITYVRLGTQGGPAVARNIAASLAKGSFIAFTDSDCLPAPDWLRVALTGFNRSEVGIVQGRTEPAQSSVPFFSHFIVTRHFDGSFSTSNVIYRRAALSGHRFDPGRYYWEDADLGWRVVADGWHARFVDSALVHHQVIPMPPLRWILWPTRFAYWPPKAKLHPRSRGNLFLGVWVRPLHMYFDLAVAGVILSRWHHSALLMTIPYALTFGRERGIRGKFPPAKVLAYVAQDSVALATLVVCSIRNRSLVL